ncbi:MAG: AAA family ATPase [Candidatus Phytoplasma sp. TWB_XP]
MEFQNQEPRNNNCKNQVSNNQLQNNNTPINSFPYDEPKNNSTFFFFAVFFMCLISLVFSVVFFWILMEKQKTTFEEMQNQLEQTEREMDKNTAEKFIEQFVVKLLENHPESSGNINPDKLKELIRNLLPRTSSQPQDTSANEQKPIEIDHFPPDTIFRPMPQDQFAKLHDFKAVTGNDLVIRQLKTFLRYLNEPLNFVGIGEVNPPSKILFYGVPGTGKTFITEAFAKEAGKEVGFYNLVSSQFSCGYVGEAPEMVRALFRDVRRHNKKHNVKASIVFIDECEEVFRDLTKSMENVSKDLPNIVNQFKTELTSIENDPKKPIIMVGATNYFWKIDDSIKSRFSSHIEIKVGDQKERQAFLNFMIKKKRKNPYDQTALDYLFKTINPLMDKFLEEERANRRLTQMMEKAVQYMGIRLGDITYNKKIQIEENNNAIIARKDKNGNELQDAQINELENRNRNLKMEINTIRDKNILLSENVDKLGEIIKKTKTKKEEYNKERYLKSNPNENILKKLKEDIKNLENDQLPYKNEIARLQEEIGKKVIIKDLRIAFYESFGIKICDQEKRAYEFNKLINAFTQKIGHAMYTDVEKNYFLEVLNPKINALMQEAHSDRLIGQLITISKRIFVEKNFKPLEKADIDKAFEEVYGGIKELPTYKD